MTKAKFLRLLPSIRKVARDCGYAIGLHGSLKRDFDIIAVPWIEDAKSPNELAFAIFDAAKGERWRVLPLDEDPKPHGRRVYCFDWKETNKNRDYCDLSVMPRVEVI